MPVAEPKLPVVPFEPTLDVAGVDGVLLMLLGAPVAAEPTLLGGLALFMVLPTEAVPPVVAVPFVAGTGVVVVVVVVVVTLPPVPTVALTTSPVVMVWFSD